MRAEGNNANISGRRPGSSLILHPSSLAAFAGMIAVIALANPVWPQALNDPTRPPPGFAVGDAEVTGDAGGPVLQSVLISSTGRAAIISGQMVKLGQKYGDAVLVRVGENEVALKSGSVTQVLRMYPDVEKRDIAPPARKKTAPRRSKARPPADPAAAGGTR